jgi:ankyrin repeat protein
MKIGPIHLNMSRSKLLQWAAAAAGLVIVVAVLINFVWFPYMERQRERERIRKLYTVKMPKCDPELVLAVAAGNLDRVKTLLDSGVHINCWACHPDNITPFCYDCKWSMDHPCSDYDCHDCRNPMLEYATPLMLAVHGGNIDIARLLINRGAEVNARRLLLAVTALEDAVIANRADLVKLLVESGAELDKNYPHNMTALLEAIHEGHIEIVRQLIGYGANVKAPGGRGRVPLVFAARCSNPVIVKLLIDHGADPNCRSRFGETPLMGAVTGSPECRVDVAKVLIARGANLNAKRRRNGPTALRMAAIRGCKCTGMVKLLLEAGADPNVKWGDGQTVLKYARAKGYADWVKLLKAYGAKE